MRVGVAPDQNRAARHQVAVDARPAITTRPSRAAAALHHPLEPLEAQVGVGQRMGEVEDRVVRLLPVDAGEVEAIGRVDLVEDHLTGLVHRGQLGGVTEEQEEGKDLAQVVELAVVQHRGFIDQPDCRAGLRAVSSR